MKHAGVLVWAPALFWAWGPGRTPTRVLGPFSHTAAPRRRIVSGHGEAAALRKTDHAHGDGENATSDRAPPTAGRTRAGTRRGEGVRRVGNVPARPLRSGRRVLDVLLRHAVPVPAGVRHRQPLLLPTPRRGV